jgi:hypothetical protein
VAGASRPGGRCPSRGQLGNLTAPGLIEPSVKFLAMVATVALLAGCAERASVGANPGPDSPVTGSPAPGPTVPAPTALEVTPRSGLLKPRPHMWQRAKPVGPRTVRVEFYGGVEECEGLARVETDYGPEDVTITLFVGRVPGAEVCIEIAVLKAVTVELDEPLRGRDIVDGARG